MHICSGNVTQMSEPWPMGLLLLRDTISECYKRRLKRTAHDGHPGMAIPTHQEYRLRYFYSAITERPIEQPFSGPSQPAEPEGMSDRLKDETRATYPFRANYFKIMQI